MEIYFSSKLRASSQFTERFVRLLNKKIESPIEKDTTIQVVAVPDPNGYKVVGWGVGVILGGVWTLIPYNTPMILDPSYSAIGAEFVIEMKEFYQPADKVNGDVILSSESYGVEVINNGSYETTVKITSLPAYIAVYLG